MPSSFDRTQASQPTDRRIRRFVIVTAACVLVATALNFALFAIGRATGSSLRLDPGAGEPNHLILGLDVVWKTALPLALGALVVVVISRYSRLLVTIFTVVVSALVAVSIYFVFTGAHDTLTGVLLASMHTLAGLAFVVIALWVRRDVATRDSRRQTRIEHTDSLESSYER